MSLIIFSSEISPWTRNKSGDDVYCDEGEALLVTQIYTAEGIWPGKFYPQFGDAFTAFDGKELTYISQYFQVLRNSSYNAFVWKEYTEGSAVPADAFPAGIDDRDDEILFSFRATINGQYHCGYVKNRTTSVPYGFKEHSAKFGDILVDGK